ncbi:MAG: slipin family protein [Capnocytophaga sp.]|nr:slipin family protein [Capnocytophaga sp.]
MFYKELEVAPNCVGLLFKKNVFQKELPAGIYKFSMWEKTHIVSLSEKLRNIRVTNQEVLTADNIALRFSFYLLYKLDNAKLFADNFGVEVDNFAIAEQQIVAIAQVLLRQKISAFNSEKLNECRNDITDFREEEFCNEVAALGLKIIKAQLIDITFPKSVQDLFARVLESKIRATSELENARTAVATARALKNASELMKGDENIKFFQYLETITKIADKGKHTFVIGEVPVAKI